MILKLIKKQIDRLTIEDMKLFCQKQNITYQEPELAFMYAYIKVNYETIIKNPDKTLKDIKPHLSNQTFEKVKKLYFEYREMYKNYL